MRDADSLFCPHCGEAFEVFPDPSGGEAQDYIEDCAVCCRPVRIRANYDEATNSFAVELNDET